MTLLSRCSTWWVVFGIWFIALQILSSIHGHPGSEQIFPHIDKVMHVGYFAAGGTALAIALRLHWEPRFPLWKPLLWTTVIATGTVVGAFDEWRQSFVAHRSGNSLADWGADILGSILACLFLPLCWKLLGIRSMIDAPSRDRDSRGSSI